jgi:hypothetical protein
MKDLNYWKNNAEEDYIQTPISVLRYITELEKEIESKQLTLTDVVKSFCKYCNNELCDSQKFNSTCFNCGKKPI